MAWLMTYQRYPQLTSVEMTIGMDERERERERERRERESNVSTLNLSSPFRSTSFIAFHVFLPPHTTFNTLRHTV
jgi:hypothetical protein